MVVPTSDDPTVLSTEPRQSSPETPNSMIDDFCPNEFPRRKKMFSSSSFYEEPNAIYPTVEEQVEMCRKIAGSLSDVCNKKSRGANMFFKRVKKAEKWVVESNVIYENETTIESTDPSKMPYVKVSKEPPKLKLILDPRHIVDMKQLKQEGISINEHNAVSPDIFHDLVKDLNSPKGKGAQLFAKRKKKSEEWVVDEEKVRAMIRDGKQQQQAGTTSSPEPIKPMAHPRVQMLKTPWDAAMQSPVGSCENAFRDISTGEIAETVIRAAEAKVMTYPSKRYSAIEPLSSQYSTTTTTFESFSQEQTTVPHPLQRLASVPSMPSTLPVVRPDAYTVRAPRGWMGASSFLSSPTPPSASASRQPEPAQDTFQPSPVPNFALKPFPPTRTYSFANFNSTARAWASPQSAQIQKPAQIKPVRPPSVLMY